MGDLDELGGRLAATDEQLMAGRFDDARARYEELLDELGGAVAGEGFERLVFRAALLVRGALCQYLVGAENEADEMLGYLDRQLSQAILHERDGERAALLYEAQENARYYRLRLEEAAHGAELELPVALCEHGRQVPLLPCGFTAEHP
ncbi:MAG TPA: hypothetical protein VNF07_02360 [Acidimicrobiales bacterium]|nr:hypothetical protein [Acidimicrobiales bacterium]